jgi:four helix bundle protein
VKAHRFEDLGCWQEARELAKIVNEFMNEANYKKDYPLNGLILNRTVSVMGAIAAGFNSPSNRDVLKFFGDAINELASLQSSLYVILDLAYIDQNMFNRLYRQIQKTRKLLDDDCDYLKKKKDYPYYKQHM